MAASWRERSLFLVLGLGPSWMVIDGVFTQLATFDRSQPEGLALATYLGAVSALANTVVVPAHAAAARRLGWSPRAWVRAATTAQLAAVGVLAAGWRATAGGASIALYGAVFLSSLAGNGQQLALNPWAAAVGRDARIVEMMAGGDVGALAAAAPRGKRRRAKAGRRYIFRAPRLAQNEVFSAHSLRPRAHFCFEDLEKSGADLFFSYPFIRDHVERVLNIFFRAQAAALATAQRALGIGPSWFFVAVGALVALACVALWHLPADAVLRGGETSTARNPLRTDDGDDDDDADKEAVWAADDDDEPKEAPPPGEAGAWAARRLSLRRPPLGDVADETADAAAARSARVWLLARSNAAYQLVAWVLLRSLLPYAMDAAAPEASEDGAAYLAAAIDGSLAACCAGAVLAMRFSALRVGAANAAMAAASGVVAAVAAWHGATGRPESRAPAFALAAAAAVIRGLDGYCTPLFYREIFTRARSVDVLQWAGILAIWVVNAGVWATLVAVAVRKGRDR